MKQRAKYGIDAPGVVRMLVVIGLLLALVAIAAFHFAKPGTLLEQIAPNAAVGACFPLVTALMMLWSSLVSKKRIRDKLVRALALTGSERVLDAGCGRGLALIGCAKKLTTGKAVGIDLWSAKDLSNNNPDATRANAAVPGRIVRRDHLDDRDPQHPLARRPRPGAARTGARSEAGRTHGDLRYPAPVPLHEGSARCGA
jgi:hypothetical protein